MIPASLRHPSVVVCAAACVLATGILTAHVFFPRGAGVACPWPGSGARTAQSEKFLTDPLPLPPLELVDVEGAALTLDSLKGRVWLCDFFLTRCNGICPALNKRMHDLGKDLDTDMKYAGVGLLSITVDPVHDTPAVLKGHRARLEAGPRWLHATWKDEKTAWRTIEEGFKLPVGPADKSDTSTPIMHSDLIVLVDAKGRIRGYYGGRDEREMKMLRGDLDRLLAEPAEPTRP